MTNKEDKGNGGNGKPLCKKVKFTLVVTLHFDNKTSKKLKSHFNSKPDVGGCNLPETKDFTKAYRKLMKKYSESLPKDSLSKSTSPQIVNRSTQILSTVGGPPSYQCGCAFDQYGGVTGNRPSAGICCNSGEDGCLCYYKM
jgi:hypothetical protein